MSIHSESENNIVGNLTSKDAWIGGKRVCAGCDQWSWTDGTPWDYVNWGTGEPNNVLGKENIMGIDGADADYGWFDDAADVNDISR